MDNIFLKLQDAITIFMGVVVGALPFVLFGVLVSAFLSGYVKEERLLKIIPKNRFGAVFVATFIGFLFPVCECGNVPVAKRLIRKGVAPYVALTFLLAAPVINPVTLFSTWAAFSILPEIVVMRFVLTFVIAAGIGLFFSINKFQGGFLNKKLLNEIDCEHDVGGTCSTTHLHQAPDQTDHFHSKLAKGKFWNFIMAIPEEFFEMMSALIIGGVLASLVQVFIPKAGLLMIGQDPFISIVSMILFALIISVCSSVDAFIALSYAGSFTGGAILAFLVFGPMIDLKSLIMFRTIFNWKTIAYLTLLIFLSVSLTCLAINLFWF